MQEEMKPEELKCVRKALGLTQAKLAVLLGVRQRQVERWEAGVYRMGWDPRERLLEILRTREAQQLLREAGVRLNFEVKV